MLEVLGEIYLLLGHFHLFLLLSPDLQRLFLFELLLLGKCLLGFLLLLQQLGFPLYCLLLRYLIFLLLLKGLLLLECNLLFCLFLDELVSESGRFGLSD